MKAKEVIVIVGAYSTGKFLASVFNGYGYQCVHIHPYQDMDRKKMDYTNSSMFIKDLLYLNNLDELLSQLRPYRVKFAVAGSEVGVLLTDLINHKLQLPFANSIKLSSARRNKFIMQEVIKNCGIASIPQCSSNNLENIIHWINNICNYPVVVKPISSSDAEGVKFCISEEEVVGGFNKILGHKTLYGEDNISVLVQKKLEGEEYVVNSVSYDGNHIVTDIWLSHKKTVQGQSVYDYQELINPSTNEAKTLIKYTEQVLTALEIRYGAAHSEIIMTKEGPILIETGARLSGGFNPSATMDALQFSQLSVLIDMYFNQQKFLMHKEMVQQKHKEILIVSLIANKKGLINKEFNTNLFMQLEGFHSIQHDFYIGKEIVITTDLTTSPGNVYLVSEDKDILYTSCNKIRMIENNLYNYLVNEQEICK